MIVPTTLNCRYEMARKYAPQAYAFGLSPEGIYKLACQIPLSRLLGLIEVKSAAGPIMDVLLDTTEADPEPAVLACIKRNGMPANSALCLTRSQNISAAQPSPSLRLGANFSG